MELTAEEKLWIEWARSLPEELQAPHDRHQAVSLSAFKAGLKVAREHARREFIEAIDRICPVDGKGS